MAAGVDGTAENTPLDNLRLVEPEGIGSHGAQLGLIAAQGQPKPVDTIIYAPPCFFHPQKTLYIFGPPSIETRHYRKKGIAQGFLCPGMPCILEAAMKTASGKD
jgi:hypothetical protein